MTKIKRIVSVFVFALVIAWSIFLGVYDTSDLDSEAEAEPIVLSTIFQEDMPVVHVLSESTVPANTAPAQNTVKSAAERREPIGRDEFVSMLSGGAAKGGDFLTREEAASLAYEYMRSNEHEIGGNVGNLSMFKDGLNVTPEYSEAVSELVRLAVLPVSGEYIKPREFLSCGDADYMAAAVRGYVPDEESSGAYRVLGTDTEGLKLIEETLSCIISSMLEEKIFVLDKKSGNRVISLALYNVVSSQTVPAEICEYKGKLAVILSQTGMRDLYDGMFAFGEFDVFDTMAAEERVMVLGECLLFLPGEYRDYTVSVGTAVKNSDGTITAACTVTRGSEYNCTASVILMRTEGWVAGLSVESVSISVG